VVVVSESVAAESFGVTDESRRVVMSGFRFWLMRLLGGVGSGVLGTTKRRAWITRIRGVCRYDGRESWGVLTPQFRHWTLTSFSTPP
jgi:hypothetical protein